MLVTRLDHLACLEFGQTLLIIKNANIIYSIKAGAMMETQT